MDGLKLIECVEINCGCRVGRVGRVARVREAVIFQVHTRCIQRFVMFDIYVSFAIRELLNSDRRRIINMWLAQPPRKRNKRYVE